MRASSPRIPVCFFLSAGGSSPGVVPLFGFGNRLIFGTLADISPFPPSAAVLFRVFPPLGIVVGSSNDKINARTLSSGVVLLCPSWAF